MQLGKEPLFARHCRFSVPLTSVFARSARDLSER